MLTQKSQKFSQNLYCKKCHYYANRKCDFKKHLQTKKHNTYKYLHNDLQKLFTCECGKKYKHRQSLNTHKKKCQFKQKSNEITDDTVKYDDTTDFKTMFMDLLQSNKELQELIIEQQENTQELQKVNKELQTQLLEYTSQPKTIIQTQNNNTFNLNNFLNVDCKDAMNLSDFLETIQYTFKDLLHLGNNGFVKSVQNTFVKQLGTMEQTKRPIHCTDKKRKTMYVKDENKWEKDQGHNKIASAIKKINKKQLKSFSIHSKQRPTDYLDNENNITTQHNIITEMCGYTDDTSHDINKKILNNMVNIVEIKKS